MKYIKRHLEAVITKTQKMFGSILVTGSRQVGKTTMLKKLNPDIPYITLDDMIMLSAASEQPTTFFKSNPPPLFIDEIQYAPNLFPQIKMLLDASKKKGQFFLSGSQQFKIMKNVSESLAGRVAILNLLGLSLREIAAIDFNKPFLPTHEYFSERQNDLHPFTYKDIWKIIHQGSMPEIYANENMDWKIFYSSYTKTYLERDVRELTQVGDEIKFMKFMTAIAASTGQLLNMAAIARSIGISQPTAERWLSILCASNLVYLLQPYHNNITKRTIKTPKIYFLDTGLAAYLTSWENPEVLQNGAMAGHFFETFIVSEILKSYINAGITDPPLYFYRDKEQNEIDLMIYQNMTLYPLEIKKHADPKREDIKAFPILDKIPGIKRGPGGVICLYDKLLPLDENNLIIPVQYV